MPHLPFTKITGDWSDKDVYIIGGGPSLIGFNFSKLRGRGVLVGINRSALDVGTDCLVSLDQHACRMLRDDIEAYCQSGKEAVLAMPPNENGHRPIEGATYVYRRRNEGLSDDPRDLYGINSGYCGLGLAYLRRARFVGLLGFDMQYAQSGKTHFHGGYSWHAKSSHKLMNQWATNFGLAAKQFAAYGARVVNYVGEPESKIEVFEKRPLGELQ